MTMTYQQLKTALADLKVEHARREADLAADMEAARATEQTAEIAIIKDRMQVLGIEPHHLFPELAQKAPRPPRNRPGRVRRPVKYAWGGKTWGGGPGPVPAWFNDAKLAGITAEQMEAEAKRLHGGKFPGAQQ